MKIKAYTLDAFTKNGSGGNPAGVVLESDDLKDIDMLNISKIINFSETAFVKRSEVADFKVQFFTPKDEVDLCGHATVATFSLMFQLNLIKQGKYTQETKAGILSVEVFHDGRIMMNQTLPIFDQIAFKDLIIDSLNITESNLLDYPLEVVSTGMRDLMVGVSSLDQLLSIKPNMEKVSKSSEIYDTIGYHLFATPGIEYKFHTRSIAPSIGIDEESATGTANGALACYLYKHQLISKSEAKDLTIEQGDILGRPSLIKVSLQMKEEEITGVFVGGYASIYQTLTIDLNQGEDTSYVG
jgi:PhzF family phenazine biosynthesis protein